VHGGRHPLPDARAFAATLGVLGIDPSDEVVVYDADAGTNAAARFWWMLRALGHNSVCVLDGGLAEANRSGGAARFGRDRDRRETAVSVVAITVCRPPTPTLSLCTRPRPIGCSSMRDPRHVSRGESEPIDPVAGHIPNARNLFHRDHLDARGRMRPVHEVRAQIEAVLGDAPKRHHELWFRGHRVPTRSSRWCTRASRCLRSTSDRGASGAGAGERAIPPDVRRARDAATRSAEVSCP
jgi:thiosulfate/3-mercaptopyruvate sulfurtransferase